ncbi:MAG: DUF3021 domain-containing protein [Clostridiales bacterium]|jgi:hypothetical protein|nr:DUF3021 domain-containing protein [Clostridiales bacterium]
MLKQAVKRGLLGIPLGIAVCFVITVIISLAIGDGYFHPVVPTLAEQLGSEINAVVFVTVLGGLLGALSRAASVIWSIESWGLAKQTGVFFIALLAIVLPISYLAHWMPRGIGGFLMFFAIFAAIYAAICIINYIVWSARVKKMNEKMPR